MAMHSEVIPAACDTSGTVEWLRMVAVVIVAAVLTQGALSLGEVG